MSGTPVLGSAVLVVTPPLVIRVSLVSLSLLVTAPLVIRVSPDLGLLVGDLSCVLGESTSMSAGASASDPISSSSLEWEGYGQVVAVPNLGSPT